MVLSPSEALQGGPLEPGQFLRARAAYSQCLQLRALLPTPWAAPGAVHEKAEEDRTGPGAQTKRSDRVVLTGC